MRSVIFTKKLREFYRILFQRRDFCKILKLNLNLKFDWRVLRLFTRIYDLHDRWCCVEGLRVDSFCSCNRREYFRNVELQQRRRHVRLLCESYRERRQRGLKIELRLQPSDITFTGSKGTVKTVSPSAKSWGSISLTRQLTWAKHENILTRARTLWRE